MTTRYKIVLTNEDHVGARHNISIGGPAGTGFGVLEVSDGDESSVVMPALNLDMLREHTKVRCIDCDCVLLEGEDFEFEEVEPVEVWR